MGQQAYKAEPQNAGSERQSEASAMPKDRPVGEILRQARMYHKLSLSDVERALNIRAVQLEAIESNHCENLPAQVYAIGFVRSYAAYLGLDVEKIVSLFKFQSAGSAPQPDLHFPVAARQAHLPSTLIVIASLLLCIAVLSFWWSGGSNNDVDAIPEVPEHLSPAAQEEAMPVQVQSEPEAEASPAPVQTGIVLIIKENSWIQIQDSFGKNVVSQVLKKGEKFFVPDRPDLKMSLGNAGGVEFTVNGEVLPLFGKAGQVRRDIPLDTQKLQALAVEQ
jgi:cytoskeletal protein RodZ